MAVVAPGAVARSLPGRAPNPRNAHPVPSSTKPAARTRPRITDALHLRRSTFTRFLQCNLIGLSLSSLRPVHRLTCSEIEDGAREPRFGTIPRRALPAACWSLELAEKLNNYLNICRIDKSSRPRHAPAPRFVRCVRYRRKMPGRSKKTVEFQKENGRQKPLDPAPPRGRKLGSIDLVPNSEQDAQNCNIAAFCCCKRQTIL